MKSGENGEGEDEWEEEIDDSLPWELEEVSMEAFNAMRYTIERERVQGMRLRQEREGPMPPPFLPVSQLRRFLPVGQRKLMTHISPSGAVKFMQCPKMFEYTQVVKIRAPINAGILRGIVIHEVLEELFGLPPEKRVPPLLFPSFKDKWTKARAKIPPEIQLFETTEEEREWALTSMEMLINLYLVDKPLCSDPMWTEKRLEFTFLRNGEKANEAGGEGGGEEERGREGDISQEAVAEHATAAAGDKDKGGGTGSGRSCSGEHRRAVLVPKVPAGGASEEENAAIVDSIKTGITSSSSTSSSSSSSSTNSSSSSSSSSSTNSSGSTGGGIDGPARADDAPYGEGQAPADEQVVEGPEAKPHPDRMTVVGVLDRLDRLNAGQLRVIDYKTGRQPHLNNSADVNKKIIEEKFLQLEVYGLLVYRELGVIPTDLRIIYLESPVGTMTAPYSRAVMERTKQQLFDVWAAMVDMQERQDFTPKVGHQCRTCTHRVICPEFGGDDGASIPYTIETKDASSQGFSLKRDS